MDKERDMRHSAWISVTLGMLLALISTTALAQPYPNKPIRLIVPYPPGGSNDIIGRMSAAQLGERLGTQVIVDNRGGAGGLIGTEMAANSPADGYTLLLISVGHAFNPSMYKLPYDPAAAFAPVAMLGTGPVALAVNAALPANSVKELIALAKQKPGQLHYASGGVGSFSHLASALFMSRSGVDVVHVPFKGGAPALVDVIAGNTQIALGSLVQTLPFINSGRLKLLGVGGAKRVAGLPDVPTIAEAGVPGYEATAWWGVLAPAGTPRPIIERLHREFSAILTSSETKKRFESEGAEAVQMTPDEFGRFLAVETKKWAEVVKGVGIRGE
jgi:tripartite-type tricarboxylate transporter receptor subunit TctC